MTVSSGGGMMAAMSATSIATILVWMALGYAAVGCVFAVAFVVAGVHRIDPAAHGAGIGFRLLILPGAAAFWPLLALRWLRGAPPPEEHNAHRAAARAPR